MTLLDVVPDNVLGVPNERVLLALRDPPPVRPSPAVIVRSTGTTFVKSTERVRSRLRDPPPVRPFPGKIVRSTGTTPVAK